MKVNEDGIAVYPESSAYRDAESDRDFGLISWALTIFSYLLFVVTFPISLIFCLKVEYEYEQAVRFRVGRLVKNTDSRRPGIFLVLPCIDTFIKVDKRVVSFDVPPQEILSRDSVTVAVDAVVYFRICNPVASVVNVQDAQRSTKLLAQTTLRNELGCKLLSEVLTDREQISHSIQHTLDVATDPWGVKVERVEIKDVRLPQQLQRAMAAEAEASREARAKVIAAEGERNSAKHMKEASDILGESKTGLQLRYLQTLGTISAEKNSTIIFPLPIDMSSLVPDMVQDAMSNNKQQQNQAQLTAGKLSSPKGLCSPTQALPSVAARDPQLPLTVRSPLAREINSSKSFSMKDEPRSLNVRISLKEDPPQSFSMKTSMGEGCRSSSSLVNEEPRTLIDLKGNVPLLTRHGGGGGDNHQQMSSQQYRGSGGGVEIPSSRSNDIPLLGRGGGDLRARLGSGGSCHSREGRL